jgi:hypothetical protein
MTGELEPGSWEIGEDQLEEAKPRVRAQTIRRYEELYARVQERVREDEAGERPLDPRFLELGIRILKEEAALYRLGRIAPAVEEEDDQMAGVDRAQVVAEQLAELEARRKDQGKD